MTLRRSMVALAVLILLICGAAVLGWRKSTKSSNSALSSVQMPPPGSARDVEKPHLSVPDHDNQGKPPELSKTHSLRGRCVRFDGVAETRFEIAAFAINDQGRVDYEAAQKVGVDREGRFAFVGLAPGSWLLRTAGLSTSLAAENVSQAVPHPGTHLKVIQPAEEDLEGVELRLPRPWILTIHVVDARGVGIANALVQGDDARTEAAITNSSGQATFELYAKREIFRVERFLDDAQARANPGRRELHSDTECWTFIVPDCEIVSGQALDPAGKPLSEYPIVAEVGGEVVSRTEANEAGEFSLPVPLDAAAMIRVENGNGHVRRATTESGEQLEFEAVLPGIRAGTTGLVVRGSWIPNDRSLTVLILGPGNRPLPGRTATLSPEHTQVFTEFSDAEGRVRFKSLPAFRFALKVSEYNPDPAKRLWFPPTGPTLVPEGQEIVVRGRESVLIRGSAKLADGRAAPFPGGRVLAGEELVADYLVIGEEGEFYAVVPADESRPLTLHIRSWAYEDLWEATVEIVDIHSPVTVVLQVASEQ